VTLRRRKRSRHKRRLANARSGLMLKATVECEDYWIFPLPPFSPGSSYRSSAPVVLEKSEVTINTDWLTLPMTPQCL
ncbi:unconventional myosin-IXb isoform X1, partial [Tachysurus ichikawai]